MNILIFNSTECPGRDTYLTSENWQGEVNLHEWESAALGNLFGGTYCGKLIAESGD